LGLLGLLTLAGVQSGSVAPGAVEEPHLLTAPLRIEPSREQVAAIPVFAAEWRLPEAMGRDLERTLGQAGFSPELAQELARRIEPGHEAGEIILRPDASLLDRFTGTERLRWWLILGTHAGNRSYRWPLVFRPENLGIVATDPAQAEALGRLRRWSVRFGERLVFSDLFALEDAFPDPAARIEFFRTMLGAEILVTRLSEAGAADRAAWAEYWQLHGRFNALEPFFDAISRVTDYDRIDLAHVLPRLPRALLNTFPPDFGSIAEPAIETAAASAGFFSMEPEKEDSLADGFTAWLRSHCRELDAAGEPAFGDILVYGDMDRSDWPFAVVYLADGLVFGRRPTFLGPWSILRQSEIPRLNPRLAVKPPRIFRRETALPAPAPAPFVRRPLPGAWAPHPTLREAEQGPWGTLRYFEVLLAPSGNLLESLPVPDPQPRWVFTGIELSEMLAHISEIPMDESVRGELHRLFAAAEPDEEGRIIVRPERSLVLATPPEFRRRVFEHLAHGGEAAAYAQEVQIPARIGAEAWFGPETLSPRARDVVLRLVYPRGGGLALSNYGTLYHSIEDPVDRISTLRTVARYPALIVMLEKPERDEVARVLDYWRTGQGKGLQRMLDSFARGGELRFLDIVHLLPPLPREFMNLYAVQRADIPQASCYWTAMNFDAERYDPVFLVPPSREQPQIRAVAERLASSYAPAPEPWRLGDVVAYRRTAGDRQIVHVCSYVAAGIVFTKNGYGYSAPWCLMHLADVDALYGQPGVVERQVYRRLK
jgi:hypothetical protein